MGTPDPLKVSMLNPPPEIKIIPERYNNKIFIYLTDSMKQKYEALKGNDETWSQIGRKALKAYFEGSHTIQMPNIEDYLREIVALVTHQQLPITQPRNLEEQEKWDLARKQAIARKTIQEPLHLDFRQACIPLLKEKFEKVKDIKNWNERYTVMGLQKKGSLEVGEKSDLELEIIMQNLEVIEK